MKFPKRSDTHIKESDSWKILKSRCPAEWIIREVSERDYGIDCYIELVNRDNEVTGDLLSVQLKGTDNIKWRVINEEMKEATFSGLAAETIHYWMNLSVPVFLFVADLNSRNVYFAPVKKQVRSQYSKYLNQDSMSFTLTNVFQLGNTLGNISFRAHYSEERSHNRFIADIRMLLVHWQRYLEFIQDYQCLDLFLGAEPDEELLFVHIYETLYTLSQCLFLDWG
nr:DUF4365 domain-containing protein [Planctomycetota bacterium]